MLGTIGAVIRWALVLCALIKMGQIVVTKNYQLAKRVEELRYQVRKANLRNGIRHPLEDLCNWLTPPRYRLLAFMLNLAAMGAALFAHVLAVILLVALYLWLWIRKALA